MRARGAAVAARLEERIADCARLQQQVAAAEELRAQVGRLEAQLETERQTWTEKVALIDEARLRLQDAFKALSADALRANNEQFLQLAETRFTTLQDSAGSALEAREKAIAELVKPIEDGLKRVDERIGTVEKERVDAYADLRRHVEEMGKGQQQLQSETQNLVQALRAPQVRGAWGEIQLRRVVEMAGMLEHCDFEEQVTTGGNGDGTRLRPDLIIRLPGGKCIVVDSKAPLEAYLRAVECQDDAERSALLEAHARQVRVHIGQLAAKSYWSQFPNAPDFVVMFRASRSSARPATATRA
jgi:DNA recombination protein RmuC